MYPVAHFQTITSYGIEANHKLLSDEAKTGKGKIRAYVSFPTTANEQILVKVGISGTSVEGARKNMNQEIPDWNFDQVQASAMNLWKDALSTVEVETSDKNLRETFYSNLYLSMIAPTHFSTMRMAPIAAWITKTMRMREVISKLHHLLTLGRLSRGDAPAVTASTQS